MRYDLRWCDFGFGILRGALFFPRNVISSNRPFAEIQFCRIIILPKQKIAESHLTESSHGRIVEFAKLHNAERHFSASLFSRTSFLRIVVQPNVIFKNRRSAERRFPETSFARMFEHGHGENLRLNDDSGKWRSAKRRFEKMTFD